MIFLAGIFHGEIKSKNINFMETISSISKLWTRIGALLIDLVILAGFGLLLGLVIPNFLIRLGNYGLLFGWMIAIVYQTLFDSKLLNGQTIGKKAVNIRVVNKNGNTISIGRSFLRSLILWTPYFFLKFPVPSIFTHPVLSFIKILFLSSILLGIVIIYMFNKGTRQSLHDLIVQTFVVRTERDAVALQFPEATKSAFYIYGSLWVILAGFFAIFVFQPNGNNDVAPGISQKIENIKGVFRSSAVDYRHFTFSDNPTTTRLFRVSLRVPKIPGGNLVNNNKVRKAIEIVLKNEKNIDQFNDISVSFVKGFDIGIAFRSNARTISESPAKWEETLE